MHPPNLLENHFYFEECWISDTFGGASSLNYSGPDTVKSGTVANINMVDMNTLLASSGVLYSPYSVCEFAWENYVTGLTACP